MEKQPVRILTYGTFDLFHVGHLRILERARLLGDELYVGVSTDEFNAKKNKSSMISFDQRIEIVSALKCVTFCFPEQDWEQKISDVERFSIDIFVMGDDWRGKFDFLKPYCQVSYLDRTPDISSSQIRSRLV